MKRGVLAGLVIAGCGALVAGLIAFAANREAPTVVHAMLSADRATSFRAFGATLRVPAHAVDRATTATVVRAHPSGSPFGDLAVPLGPAVRVDVGAGRLHWPITVTAPGTISAEDHRLAFVATYESSARGWRPVPAALHRGRLSVQLIASAALRIFEWRPAALAARISRTLGEWSRLDRTACPLAPRDTHVIVQNWAGAKAPSMSACVLRVDGDMVEVSFVNPGATAYVAECCWAGDKVLAHPFSQGVPSAAARRALATASGGTQTLLEPHGRMTVRFGLGRAILFGSERGNTLGEVLAATFDRDRQLAGLTPSPFSCLDNDFTDNRTGRRVAGCVESPVPAPVSSWAVALRAAVQSPQVTAALRDTADADTAQFTIVHASDRELAEPILGTETSEFTSGYGFAHQSVINGGGDEGGVVWDVHWTNWGGPHATATGTAYWGGPHSVSMAAEKPKPAAVVAYDLGSCQGRLAYRKVEWYFPEFGQRFHDDRWHSLSICGRGYYAVR